MFGSVPAFVCHVPGPTPRPRAGLRHQLASEPQTGHCFLKDLVVLGLRRRYRPALRFRV